MVGEVSCTGEGVDPEFSEFERLLDVDEPLFSLPLSGFGEFGGVREEHTR